MDTWLGEEISEILTLPIRLLPIATRYRLLFDEFATSVVANVIKRATRVSVVWPTIKPVPECVAMACTAALPAVSREQLRATIAGKCQ